jgi:hypothetical protein
MVDDTRDEREAQYDKLLSNFADLIDEVHQEYQHGAAQDYDN